MEKYEIDCYNDCYDCYDDDEQDDELDLNVNKHELKNHRQTNLKIDLSMVNLNDYTDKDEYLYYYEYNVLIDILTKMCNTHKKELLNNIDRPKLQEQFLEIAKTLNNRYHKPLTIEGLRTLFSNDRIDSVSQRFNLLINKEWFKIEQRSVKNFRYKNNLRHNGSISLVPNDITINVLIPKLTARG